MELLGIADGERLGRARAQVEGLVLDRGGPLSSLGELAALEELGWWGAGFRGMLGPLRPYSSDCNPETPGTSGGL